MRTVAMRMKTSLSRFQLYTECAIIVYREEAHEQKEKVGNSKEPFVNRTEGEQ